MITSLGANLSALDAFGKRMQVTSNNIANADSLGFKKSRALIKEGLNNNVEVEVTRIESPGHILTETVEGKPSEKESSNVDLTEEIPQTISTQRGYEANIKFIETQEEVLGSILDIIG